MRLTLAGIAAFTMFWVGCGPPPDGHRPPQGKGPGGGRSGEAGSVTAVIGKDSDAPVVTFAANDWPQWRGPTESGVGPNADVPVKWDAKTNIVWQAEVPGRGHGSPIVVGELVAVATAVRDSQQQLVVALDRATGDERWRKVVLEGNFPEDREIHNKATNANSTLASDGDSLFCVFFNNGKIVVTALDLKGERLWQKEVGDFRSKFGYAPSPVIFRSTVIVAADNWGGGYIVALDRKTGEVAWRAPRPAVSTYSSPLVANIAGRDQLVISGCDKIVSYDPATGKELWSCNAIAEATCGTPVTDGTHVFASGGFPNNQTVAVNGDGSGKIAWSDRTKVYEPSLVLVGNHVFAVTDDGIGMCWSVDSGKVAWKQRIGGSFSASPMACNGNIYVPNLSGETVVFKANGDRYQEVARNRLGSDSYASIAVSGTYLFMRVGFNESGSRKERVVCIGTPK